MSSKLYEVNYVLWHTEPLHDDKLIGVAAHHIAAVYSGVLLVQARGKMRMGGGWEGGGGERIAVRWPILNGVHTPTSQMKQSRSNALCGSLFD